MSNIVYDKKLRQYILGANMAVRSSRNTSQLRSFTQLMWLAFFANRLTGQKNLQLFEMYIIHLKLLKLTLKINLNLTT
uniref:DNA topoisomerase VI subunit A (Top6A) n=1 Tax=uncultured marine thaumarchaeote AD1000_33_B07 TaxID=1455908 RepID=A0A075FU93_9ARCH|nr:DNA topoisomerase VI subunit A (top6A) [uncultured marine thaumarchaeote AD1000_33_B07]